MGDYQEVDGRRVRHQGTVSTWRGNVDYEIRTTIPSELAGTDCSLCGKKQASQKYHLRMEWETWLRENRDYVKVADLLYAPLCGPCEVRVDSLRDGEVDYGRYPEEMQQKIDEARMGILGRLDLDKLIEESTFLPET